MFDMNQYRTNPGRCASLKSMLESAAFKEAVEAITNTNKVTDALTVATNMDASDRMESRLFNQNIGREDILRCLEVCSEPIVPPAQEQQADYGAPEALAALSGPDAPAEPWQPGS